MSSTNSTDMMVLFIAHSFCGKHFVRTVDCRPAMQNYLVVSVVVSVIFLIVVPPPAGVAGVVVVFVSTVVVVLPSLVCDDFVSVLFSVVPFWLSQPMVNMPSTAIKTDAKKNFIFTPSKKIGVLSHQQRCPFTSSLAGATVP